MLQKRVRLHQKQKAFRRSSTLYRGFVGGRGSGKSWVGAYDMIARAKAGRTYLVAAPTYPMLQDASLRTFLGIARELGVLDTKHIKKAPPPACRLLTGAEILFRSADDPERLRGPNLSGVWLDEASLMHKDAYDIAIACLREGGEQGWLSATFTPKGISHWTYDYFGKQRPDTELFRARTADNPFNPPEFHETLARQYGAGSAFGRQELEGEFVEDDDAWQVIPSAWVRLAQARWTPERPAGQALSAIGADVAHGGADKTAIAPRYGVWFAPVRKYQGKETDTGEKAAHLVLREYPDGSDAPVNVDAIGWGSECHAELRRLLGKRAKAINVAEAPDPPVFDRTKKYKLTNYRAVMHWQMREALDPVNGDNVALPPDEELLGDLTAARFEVRASGILIEKKANIKDRLGRSPDVGEAVMLANLHTKLWKLTADKFFV